MENEILPKILKKDIFNISCPNIIFYGYHIDLKNYFNSVFGNFKYIVKDKITYQNNLYCKIFDIDQIKSKETDNFFSLLFEIISSGNYYSKYHQHIIIFDNYNNISPNIQNKLRVIVEKYRKTTQFILITNKINTIINPIRSRCLCIRIPNMKMKQKRRIAAPYLKDKSYEEKIPIYNCIYLTNDINTIINYSKYNDYIHSHEDIYLKVYQKLNSWINNANDIKLTEIKEYSYNILKYDIHDIHRKLYESFIKDPKYIGKQKCNLTKIITDCEYEYCKSYRSLVHIEKMFIEIIYLLA
tara:strand:- start:1270 stop:2163 length:894 start_codon:yes stop_codon:yes gene_type:complete